MKKLILLFDIDGTLIRTGGAGQLAIESVVAGKSGIGGHGIRLAGRTDRGIFGDFLDHYGVGDTDENYDAHKQPFLETLATCLTECDGHVLPRVVETLECVANQPTIGLGLITGNMRAAAKQKLVAYGLDRFFFQDRPDGVGGFGDRHRDRDDVARDALAEAREYLLPAVDPEHVWIIGDTPNDVKCARAIGAKVVAVATGSYSLEELAATDADHVIESLDHAAEWWAGLADEYGIATPTSG